MLTHPTAMSANGTYAMCFIQKQVGLQPCKRFGQSFWATLMPHCCSFVPSKVMVQSLSVVPKTQEQTGVGVQADALSVNKC